VIGSSLITAVNVLFQLVSLLILVRVILSWLPVAGVRIDPFNPLVRILFHLTDPILEPIRRVATFGMMDLSPIIALILLDIIRRLLVSLLASSL
jgi:YggT family protein